MPGAVTHQALIAGYFSPRNIPNLAFWVDASNAGSITIATGVSQWNDLSGNGRNLTQATTTKQPALQSAALNGKDYVQFDGTSDIMSNTGWTSVSNPITICGVSRIRSSGAFFGPVGQFGTGSFGISHVFDSGVGGAAYRMYSSASIAGSAPVFNVWNYFTVEWNGASSFARASAASIIGTGDAGSSTASGYYLGANQPESIFFPVDVAEICIYAGALTAAQYGVVEGYLKAKWGL